MSQPDERQTDAEGLLSRARMAAAVFEQFDQEATDRIVARVARVALDHRVKLARMAHEETRLGVWEHKVIKNVMAAQMVHEDIRHERTVGVLSDDPRSGIMEIAQPLGPVLAVIPVTNPTSTTIFKTLICLKTRNPIIISPHGRAIGCCAETARLCYEAALEEGAPEDCIQWITQPGRDLTHALMTHPHLALILATGGTGLVQAAYSSGTPAIGVGPGNVPVYIEKSADIPFAVESVLASKTFDNGTICASEQAIVVEQDIAGAVRSEFERQGCFFLDPDQIRKVEAIAVDAERGTMNAAIVGQSVAVLAEVAGITVPDGTRLLLAEQHAVGEAHPLSGEILAPILAFYETRSFDGALKTCIELNYRGGIGHTASIYSNDDGRIHAFATLMNAGRVMVNTPSAHGAVGGLYNSLLTSFTLGCGAGGKNITTENISARHLINTKRVCRRRTNERWARFPAANYLDESLEADTLLRAYNRNY